MVSNKTPMLNMGIQAGKIRSLFPLSNPIFNQDVLSWKYVITPSPLSASYEVKLSYNKGFHPNVYVLVPALRLYPGETKLPHVYDTRKQWLCLYYRKGREWNSSMLIADTVIPWTCEWLLHYECWVVGGTWQGGGIEHNSALKKSAEQIEKDKA